jgi:MFS family permease
VASSYRWVILALTVAGFMQTHIHRLAFAGLIPVFVTDLGVNYAAAGTIQTAYFWTYMLVQVPIGLAADRWGPRRVMLCCMAVLGAGALAFAASTTYLAAIAARMLVGLGAAAVWVPGMRLVSEWFPAHERGRAMGVMSAGGGVGGTLGLIVVPWLAGFWGWRIAYGAMAMPAIVTAVLFALFLRGSVAGAVTRAEPGAFRRVLGARELIPFNLNVCFSYGAYFSLITFLPAFLVRSLGFTSAEAGLVTGLVTAATIVSWPLGGMLSDRLGRRKPVILASQGASILIPVIFAVGMPRVGLVGTMGAAILTGFLVGGLILPFVMIVEMFPRELVATASGVANSACFVGAMFLPIVLGRLVDVTGGFGWAFAAAGVTQALAFVFALFLPETGTAVRGTRAIA